jgi:2-oxoglutarate ferredoxin oxidoreductase subunit beta
MPVSVKDYLRERFMPHIWCPGCGHGIIMNNLIRAIISLGIRKNDIVMVTGIGCSSRISGYIAFATGVKLSRPELTIIAPMGDGDALAIGGNHFIHAARRNIDITAIVMNNRIYGMTGGQFSPLSGYGTMATTAPYGNIYEAFDIVELAKGAGASFVARTTTYHVTSMQEILEKAMRHKGFSVVEILTQCPTYFGRKNRMGDAVDMLNYFKEKTTPIGSGKKEKDPSLIERGIFVQEERTEYCAEYDKIVGKARGR